ncbi:hypothetical protein P154DRAFT_519657, partial [Amniculicola lignicola CBS 123094]
MSAAEQQSSPSPPTASLNAPSPAPANPVIALRSPSSLPATAHPTIAPPPLSFLTGTWNVTHSTLPMWKTNKNVKITYTPVAGTSPVHIDDVVTYQGLNSTSTKTVHGLDKPFSVTGEQAAAALDADAETTKDVASLGYNWRGKGWLMIASSKWEILGYGVEEGTTNEWVVTYFAKTLFTPVGVDFYSRNGKLKEETVVGIKKALEGLGSEVAKLAKGVFEVGMD